MASVEIRGLNKLVRELKQFDGELAAELRGVHRDVASDVAETAHGIVPRRSGRLAATIRASSTQRSGVVRAGKSSVPYAGPIHFGWARRNIRPQPFLYAALDKRRQDVVDRYVEALTKIADRVG